MTKHKVIILEDEELYLRSWKLHMTDVDIHSFTTIDDLLDAIEDKDLLIQDISLIILDYYVGLQNIYDANLINDIRKFGYRRKICVCSNLKINMDEKGCWDYVIPKRAMSLRDLSDKYKGLLDY